MSDPRREFSQAGVLEARRSQPSPATLLGPAFGEPYRLSAPGTASCSLPYEGGEDSNNILRTQTPVGDLLPAALPKNETANPLLSHTMASCNRMFSTAPGKLVSDMQLMPSPSMDSWPPNDSANENGISTFILAAVPSLQRDSDLPSAVALRVDAPAGTSAPSGLCHSLTKLPLDNEIETERLMRWSGAESALQREAGYSAAMPVSSSRDLYKGPTQGHASQFEVVSERGLLASTGLNRSHARNPALPLKSAASGVRDVAGLTNNGAIFSPTDASVFGIPPRIERQKSAEGHFRDRCATANVSASSIVPTASSDCLHSDLLISNRVRDPMSSTAFGCRFTGQPWDFVGLGRYSGAHRHQNRDACNSTNKPDGIQESVASFVLSTTSATAGAFGSTAFCSLKESEQDDVLDGCYDSEEDKQMRRLLTPLPDSSLEKELFEMQFDFQQERQWKQRVALMIGTETAQIARLDCRNHASTSKSNSGANVNTPHHDLAASLDETGPLPPKPPPGDLQFGNFMLVSEPAVHEQLGVDKNKRRGKHHGTNGGGGEASERFLAEDSFQLQSELCTVVVDTEGKKCFRQRTRKADQSSGDEGCLGSESSLCETLREEHHPDSWKHAAALSNASQHCKACDTNSDHDTQKPCLVDSIITEEKIEPSISCVSSRGSTYMNARHCRKAMCGREGLSLNNAAADSTESIDFCSALNNFSDTKNRCVPLVVPPGDTGYPTSTVRFDVDESGHRNSEDKKHEVEAQMIRSADETDAIPVVKNIENSTNGFQTAAQGKMHPGCEKVSSQADSTFAASTVYKSDHEVEPCRAMNGRRATRITDARVEKKRRDVRNSVCNSESYGFTETTAHSHLSPVTHSADHGRIGKSVNVRRGNGEYLATHGGEQHTAELSHSEGCAPSRDKGKCTFQEEGSAPASSARSLPLTLKQDDASIEPKMEKKVQEGGGNYKMPEQTSALRLDLNVVSENKTPTSVPGEKQGGEPERYPDRRKEDLPQQEGDAGTSEKSGQKTDTRNTADLSASSSQKREARSPRAASADRNIDILLAARNSSETASPRGRMRHAKASRRTRRGFRGGRQHRSSLPILTSPKKETLQVAQCPGKASHSPSPEHTTSRREQKTRQGEGDGEIHDWSSENETALGVRRPVSSDSVLLGIQETESNEQAKGDEETAWCAERDRCQEAFLRASVVDDETGSVPRRGTNLELRTPCESRVVRLGIFKNSVRCTSRANTDKIEPKTRETRIGHSAASGEPSRSSPSREAACRASNLVCSVVTERAENEVAATRGSRNKKQVEQTESTTAPTQRAAAPCPPDPSQTTATGGTLLAAACGVDGISREQTKSWGRPVEENEEKHSKKAANLDLMIGMRSNTSPNDSPSLYGKDCPNSPAAWKCGQTLGTERLKDGDERQAETALTEDARHLESKHGGTDENRNSMHASTEDPAKIQIPDVRLPDKHPTRDRGEGDTDDKHRDRGDRYGGDRDEGDTGEGVTTSGEGRGAQEQWKGADNGENRERNEVEKWYESTVSSREHMPLTTGRDLETKTSRRSKDRQRQRPVVTSEQPTTRRENRVPESNPSTAWNSAAVMAQRERQACEKKREQQKKQGAETGWESKVNDQAKEDTNQRVPGEESGKDMPLFNAKPLSHVERERRTVVKGEALKSPRHASPHNGEDTLNVVEAQSSPERREQKRPQPAKQESEEKEADRDSSKSASEEDEEGQGGREERGEDIPQNITGIEEVEEAPALAASAKVTWIADGQSEADETLRSELGSNEGECQTKKDVRNSRATQRSEDDISADENKGKTNAPAIYTPRSKTNERPGPDSGISDLWVEREKEQERGHFGADSGGKTRATEADGEEDPKERTSNEHFRVSEEDVFHPASNLLSSAVQAFWLAIAREVCSRSADASPRQVTGDEGKPEESFIFSSTDSTSFPRVPPPTFSTSFHPGASPALLFASFPDVAIGENRPLDHPGPAEATQSGAPGVLRQEETSRKDQSAQPHETSQTVSGEGHAKKEERKKEGEEGRDGQDFGRGDNDDEDKVDGENTEEAGLQKEGCESRITRDTQVTRDSHTVRAEEPARDRREGREEERGTKSGQPDKESGVPEQGEDTLREVREERRQSRGEREESFRQMITQEDGEEGESHDCRQSNESLPHDAEDVSARWDSACPPSPASCSAAPSLFFALSHVSPRGVSATDGHRSRHDACSTAYLCDVTSGGPPERISLVPEVASSCPATATSSEAPRIRDFASSPSHCSQASRVRDLETDRENPEKMQPKSPCPIPPSSLLLEPQDQRDALSESTRSTLHERGDRPETSTHPPPLADFLRLSTSDCGVHCFTFYLRGGSSATLPLLLGLRERLLAEESSCLSSFLKAQEPAQSPPPPHGLESPTPDSRAEPPTGPKGDSWTLSQETGADVQRGGGALHCLGAASDSVDENSGIRGKRDQSMQTIINASTMLSASSENTKFVFLNGPPDASVGYPQPHEVKKEAKDDARESPPERGGSDCGFAQFPSQDEKNEEESSRSSPAGAVATRAPFHSSSCFLPSLPPSTTPAPSSTPSTSGQPASFPSSYRPSSCVQPPSVPASYLYSTSLHSSSTQSTSVASSSSFSSASVPPSALAPAACSASHSLRCASSVPSTSSCCRASSALQFPSAREGPPAERAASVASTGRLFDLATHCRAGKASAKKLHALKRDKRAGVDAATYFADSKLKREELRRQGRRKERRRERARSALRCCTYLGDELRRSCRAFFRRRLIDEYFARYDREEERLWLEFGISRGRRTRGVRQEGEGRVVPERETVCCWASRGSSACPFSASSDSSLSVTCPPAERRSASSNVFLTTLPSVEKPAKMRKPELRHETEERCVSTLDTEEGVFSRKRNVFLNEREMAAAAGACVPQIRVCDFWFCLDWTPSPSPGAADERTSAKAEAAKTSEEPVLRRKRDRSAESAVTDPPSRRKLRGHVRARDGRMHEEGHGGEEEQLRVRESEKREERRRNEEGGQGDEAGREEVEGEGFVFASGRKEALRYGKEVLKKEEGDSKKRGDQRRICAEEDACADEAERDRGEATRQKGGGRRSQREDKSPRGNGNQGDEAPSEAPGTRDSGEKTERLVKRSGGCSEGAQHKRGEAREEGKAAAHRPLSCAEERRDTVWKFVRVSEGKEPRVLGRQEETKRETGEGGDEANEDERRGKDSDGRGIHRTEKRSEDSKGRGQTERGEQDLKKCQEERKRCLDASDAGGSERGSEADREKKEKHQDMNEDAQTPQTTRREVDDSPATSLKVETNFSEEKKTAPTDRGTEHSLSDLHAAQRGLAASFSGEESSEASDKAEKRKRRDHPRHVEDEEEELTHEIPENNPSEGENGSSGCGAALRKTEESKESDLNGGMSVSTLCQRQSKNSCCQSGFSSCDSPPPFSHMVSQALDRFFAFFALAPGNSFLPAFPEEAISHYRNETISSSDAREAEHPCGWAAFRSACPSAFPSPVSSLASVCVPASLSEEKIHCAVPRKEATERIRGTRNQRREQRAGLWTGLTETGGRRREREEENDLTTRLSSAEEETSREERQTSELEEERGEGRREGEPQSEPFAENEQPSKSKHSPQKVAKEIDTQSGSLDGAKQLVGKGSDECTEGCLRSKPACKAGSCETRKEARSVGNEEAREKDRRQEQEGMRSRACESGITDEEIQRENDSGTRFLDTAIRQSLLWDALFSSWYDEAHMRGKNRRASVDSTDDDRLTFGGPHCSSVFSFSYKVAESRRRRVRKLLCRGLEVLDRVIEAINEERYRSVTISEDASGTVGKANGTVDGGRTEADKSREKDAPGRDASCLLRKRNREEQDTTGEAGEAKRTRNSAGENGKEARPAISSFCLHVSRAQEAFPVSLALR
ncbi:UNVERIFIED_CONTAM: hypothetical protein HHA_271010 [Hammondia hammondi]|eukprot:XP_008882470.1 hypothetical protein HHA_271010 [Hammondia hammondi]